MTEQEARTKWCPMVRIAVFSTSVNRIKNSDSTHCIASGCMMWRPLPWQSGYCGLGGKPNE
jgi:hypothetical protein